MAKAPASHTLVLGFAVAAIGLCGLALGLALTLELSGYRLWHIAMAAVAICAVSAFVALGWRRKFALMEQSAEAGRLLQEALDRVPDGIALYDSADRLVYVNPAFLEGREDLQAILKPGITFEEQLRQREKLGIRRTTGWPGVMISVEDRLRHQRESGRPIRSATANGRIVEVDVLKTESDGRLVVRRDITERENFESDLRRSEARFRDFASATSDWFWEMDEELRFTYFSPSVEEITGVPPEWHYGKTREDIGVPESISPEVWQAHLETLARREPYRNFAYLRKGPEGDQWLVSSGVPVFDEAGDFKGYRGIGSDISARVQAEMSLEAVASSIEQLSEQFALWGPDDRLIICNSEWRKINEAVLHAGVPGTLFEAYVRAALEKGLFPEAQGREEEWFQERIARHKTPGTPFEIQRQDGRWVLVNEETIANGATVTIGIDITERKSFEVALFEAKEQAELANRSKSEFLANMSHELRTPLNSIIGFAQVIARRHIDGMTEERRSEYAEDIIASGEHLLRVISDILDISRVEAGELDLQETQLDLRQLAATAVRMMRERSEAKALRLDIEAKDAPVHVVGDELRIRQVLLNLLSNAIKFTPSGGTVTVRISGSDVDGGTVEVIDTGIGISAEDLPRITKPFEQVRESHIQAHEGTGLGLYLVKSLVEAHGGTLSIESEPGKGTRVTVAFPASANPAVGIGTI